jgi:cobalt-zinc-cadmium efflux system protein
VDGHDAHRLAERRHLATALALVTGYLVAEVVVALLAHSVALLSDAGHMLTDAGALAGAIWAMRLAARPSTPTWSFGLKRAEILAAAANGVTLLVAGVLLLVEAVIHLVHPAHPSGAAMIVVAGVGVPVNLAATWVLSRSARASLNIEAAFRHVLTDLYGIVATAVAGAVILATGWARADAVAGLFIVALVLRAAAGLLASSGRILLEGTPEAVDLEEVRAHLRQLPEVVTVHDLHAWTLTSDLPALSAHVVVTDACLEKGSAAGLLDRLQACLADHFDVEHSTFQLEAVSHLEHERRTHD